MGLLDGTGLDPQTMGLLGASAGLLSAAGPSRMPMNFASALAQGAQGALQGYGQGVQLQGLQQKNQLLGAQTQIALMNAKRQMALQDFLASRYGINMSGAPVAPGASAGGPGMPGGAAPPPAGAPRSGIEQRSLMPTDGGGEMGGAADAAGGAAAPGGSMPNGAPSSPGPSPAAPPVASPVTLPNGNPLSYNEAEFIKSQGGPDLTGRWTTEMKTAMAVYGENSPQYKAAIEAQVKKAGFIPPTVLRDGGVALGADGKPIFAAPSKEGGQLQFDATGRPIMTQVPGAGAVTAAHAFSQAAGTGAALPETGYGANGQSQFTNRTAAATGGLNIPGLPNTGGAAGALTPQPPPGVVPAIEGDAKAGAERLQQTRAAVQDAPVRIDTLDQIINLSKSGVQTGKGVEGMNDLKNYVLQTPGLAPIARYFGAGEDVKGFQELHKLMLVNAANAWRSAGGTGTDAQLATFQKANVNPEMLPGAIQDIARYTKSIEQGNLARANGMDAYVAQNGPQSVSKFETEWRKTFDPRIFQLQTMEPDQAAAFVNSLSKADALTLRTKRLTMMKNGWLQ